MTETVARREWSAVPGEWPAILTDRTLVVFAGEGAEETARRVLLSGAAERGLSAVLDELVRGGLGALPQLMIAEVVPAGSAEAPSIDVVGVVRGGLAVTAVPAGTAPSGEHGAVSVDGLAAFSWTVFRLSGVVELVVGAAVSTGAALAPAAEQPVAPGPLAVAQIRARVSATTPPVPPSWSAWSGAVPIASGAASPAAPPVSAAASPAVAPADVPPRAVPPAVLPAGVAEHTLAPSDFTEDVVFAPAPAPAPPAVSPPAPAPAAPAPPAPAPAPIPAGAARPGFAAVAAAPSVGAAPNGFAGRFDELFGATIQSGVEAAAVRHDAPAAGAPGQPEGGIDDSSAGVTGVLCPAGHANPLERTVCAVCQQPLTGGAIGRVAHPSLGVMVLPDGTEIVLGADLLVGRSPRSERVEGGEIPELVVLDHRDVSRTHVRVAVEGWRVLVEDLGSTNGTVLRTADGRTHRVRVGEPVIVPDGAVVELGGGPSLVFRGIP